ncbi:MAG: sodium:alanine symporter family protein [Chlamydiae bacterium]|nr:sodium:alanine symporter family protein [Chlamydiota bacterium]
MLKLQQVIDRVNEGVWGVPLLALLTGVGLYLSWRLRGVQFRYFWYAHRLAFTREDRHAEGAISHFQALMTALAGTIGIGSITGVATAMTLGGVGAIFWMWVAAGLGMATKYAEAVLAVKYREVDGKGEVRGGPMYYLSKGLNQKWLARAFAIFGLLAAIGTGNMVQSNSVAIACKDLLNIDPLYTGVGLMLACGLFLLRGIKSIGKLSSILIPAMALFYILGGFFIICFKIKELPWALLQIVKAGLTPQAALGGFAGASIMQAIQSGMSRGVFSSEAGLGTSPIAAAAARTDTPSRHALVSMCSVFITTGIVCSITALTIVLTRVLGCQDSEGQLITGSTLVMQAFNRVIPWGGIMVTLALIPFAFSTIIGWAYYGEKCSEYLLGSKAVIYYRILYITLIIPGAVLSLEMVWGLANIFNGLMAFPNLIGLVGLAGVVAKETELFDKLHLLERKSLS